MLYLVAKFVVSTIRLRMNPVPLWGYTPSTMEKDSGRIVAPPTAASPTGKALRSLLPEFNDPTSRRFEHDNIIVARDVMATKEDQKNSPKTYIIKTVRDAAADLIPFSGENHPGHVRRRNYFNYAMTGSELCPHHMFFDLDFKRRDITQHAHNQRVTNEYNEWLYWLGDPSNTYGAHTFIAQFFLAVTVHLTRFIDPDAQWLKLPYPDQAARFHEGNPESPSKISRFDGAQLLVFRSLQADGMRAYLSRGESLDPVSIPLGTFLKLLARDPFRDEFADTRRLPGAIDKSVYNTNHALRLPGNTKMLEGTYWNAAASRRELSASVVHTDGHHYVPYTSVPYARLRVTVTKRQRPYESLGYDDVVSLVPMPLLPFSAFSENDYRSFFLVDTQTPLYNLAIQQSTRQFRAGQPFNTGVYNWSDSQQGLGKRAMTRIAAVSAEPVVLNASDAQLQQITLSLNQDQLVATSCFRTWINHQVRRVLHPHADWVQDILPQDSHFVVETGDTQYTVRGGTNYCFIKGATHEHIQLFAVVRKDGWRFYCFHPTCIAALSRQRTIRKTSDTGEVSELVQKGDPRAGFLVHWGRQRDVGSDRDNFSVKPRFPVLGDLPLTVSSSMALEDPSYINAMLLADAQQPVGAKRPRTSENVFALPLPRLGHRTVELRSSVPQIEVANIMSSIAPRAAVPVHHKMQANRHSLSDYVAVSDVYPVADSREPSEATIVHEDTPVFISVPDDPSLHGALQAFYESIRNIFTDFSNLISLEYSDDDAEKERIMGDLRFIFSYWIGPMDFQARDSQLTQHEMHRSSSTLIDIVAEYDGYLRGRVATGDASMPRFPLIQTLFARFEYVPLSEYIPLLNA